MLASHRIEIQRGSLSLVKFPKDGFHCTPLLGIFIVCGLYYLLKKSFEFVAVLPVSDHARDIDMFSMHPSKFPKRIKISISERVVDLIQAISARRGRSFS